MADRVLRGSRLGSTSYEADRNHDLAPRRTATYSCPRDHEFAVPMADDAEVPAVWSTAGSSAKVPPLSSPILRPSLTLPSRSAIRCCAGPITAPARSVPSYRIRTPEWPDFG